MLLHFKLFNILHFSTTKVYRDIPIILCFFYTLKQFMHAIVYIIRYLIFKNELLSQFEIYLVMQIGLTFQV